METVVAAETERRLQLEDAFDEAFDEAAHQDRLASAEQISEAQVRTCSRAWAWREHAEKEARTAWCLMCAVPCMIMVPATQCHGAARMQCLRGIVFAGVRADSPGEDGAAAGDRAAGNLPTVSRGIRIRAVRPGNRSHASRGASKRCATKAWSQSLCLTTTETMVSMASTKLWLMTTYSSEVRRCRPRTQPCKSAMPNPAAPRESISR